jgi:hypothetical protein
MTLDWTEQLVKGKEFENEMKKYRNWIATNETPTEEEEEEWRRLENQSNMSR